MFDPVRFFKDLGFADLKGGRKSAIHSTRVELEESAIPKEANMFNYLHSQTLPRPAVGDELDAENDVL